MKTGDYKNDQNIGKKEARDGDQQIRKKGGTAVVKTAPEDGCSDADWKREGPGDDGAHDEQGETIEESLPNLSQDGLIILPGYSLSCKKISIEVNVLEIKGFVEMKFFAKSFHHLGCKLGVERVHLARLARGKVNDQKRYYRDKKQGDDLLNNTPPHK